MKWRDLVIGRGGDSLGGKVLDSSFTITSSFGQPLTFKTRDIRWIHFRNPPQFAADEIWAVGDDHIRGKIEGRAVRFRPAGREPITIPYGAIHTLIVNQAFDSPKTLTGR
ncbi:MAG TPA: hypothetical protein VGK89_10375 [Candidatus Eisenbacteria bacterium]|jgi:hypothetical protein